MSEKQQEETASKVGENLTSGFFEDKGGETPTFVLNYKIITKRINYKTRR